MKLKVLQENLHTSLNNASRFVSAKAQLPVLANILLKATKTKLMVSSTNLEIAISSSIGAQVTQEGEIAVPARALTEIVSNLLPGTITLTAEKEQLKIESQNSTLNVLSMNTADFPVVPQKIDAKDAISLPKDSFVEGLSQVLFASSIDETRPVLTGVLMIFKPQELVLVATDGFRLSQKRIEGKGLKKNQKLILPKAVLVEASRLSSEGEDVLFGYKESENQAVFGFSDTVLSSRVLEGEFPDIEKIMPKETSLSVELDKEDFLRAVKLSAVFARESANIVKLVFSKNNAKISAESPSSGSQDTEIEAKTEGSGVEIAFNYRFLEEFLHVTRGETVKIGLSSASSPGVFTDPSDKTFMHLIMPVRVQG